MFGCCLCNAKGLHNLQGLFLLYFAVLVRSFLNLREKGRGSVADDRPGACLI